MNSSALVLELITLSFALWLGLYLLARDARNPSMLYAGLGLAAYALALAFNALHQVVSEHVGAAAADSVARLGWPLIFMPALFWFGSLFFLLPNEDGTRQRWGSVIKFGLIPLAVVFYAVAAASELIIVIDDGDLSAGPLFPLMAGLLAVLWLIGLLLLVRAYSVKSKRLPISAILTVTIFFGLGLGLILFPVVDLPLTFLLLAVGFDLALLGMAIAYLDAFDQGEAMLPEMGRSFLFSLLITLLFAGQIGLAMVISTGVTTAMFVLLLAAVITAIVITVFSDALQTVVDGLAFSQLPHVLAARDNSRLLLESAPRFLESMDPDLQDEQVFTKMTRKALRHLGDLPHLSASPLTRMPIISKRLAERSAPDNSLERVAELKALLLESIQQLKPRDQGERGFTDEWRFYNSLYYPYVAGLKPYSRRMDREFLDDQSTLALTWFQQQVPERTLYNWQNAAAALVAQDLRERSQLI